MRHLDICLRRHLPYLHRSLSLFTHASRPPLDHHLCPPQPQLTRNHRPCLLIQRRRPVSDILSVPSRRSSALHRCLWPSTLVSTRPFPRPPYLYTPSCAAPAASRASARKLPTTRQCRSSSRTSLAHRVSASLVLLLLLLHSDRRNHTFRPSGQHTTTTTTTTCIATTFTITNINDTITT